MSSVGFFHVWLSQTINTNKIDLVSKVFFYLETLCLVVLIRVDTVFYSETIVCKEDVSFIILTACFLLLYATVNDFDF